MASQPHALGSCQATVGVCTHPSISTGLARMKQSLSPPGHLQLRSLGRHTACLSSPKQRSQGEEATDRSQGPQPGPLLAPWAELGAGGQETGNRSVTSQGEAVLVGG